MDWRDISTAPKDKPVLGWSPEQDPYEAANGIAVIEWSEADSKWEVVHDAEGYQWNYYQPTHWTDLPGAPNGHANAPRD